MLHNKYNYCSVLQKKKRKKGDVCANKCAIYLLFEEEEEAFNYTFLNIFQSEVFVFF